MFFALSKVGFFQFKSNFVQAKISQITVTLLFLKTSDLWKSFSPVYTAVSRKVVLQSGKSLGDNVESY